MSRTGVCYDNAVKESFFATLKAERVHDQHYRDTLKPSSTVFAISRRSTIGAGAILLWAIFPQTNSNAGTNGCLSDLLPNRGNLIAYNTPNSSMESWLLLFSIDETVSDGATVCGDSTVSAAATTPILRASLTR